MPARPAPLVERAGREEEDGAEAMSSLHLSERRADLLTLAFVHKAR